MEKDTVKQLEILKDELEMLRIKKRQVIRKHQEKIKSLELEFEHKIGISIDQESYLGQEIRKLEEKEKNG